MIFMIDSGSRTTSMKRKNTRKYAAFLMINLLAGSYITIISCYFNRLVFVSSGIVSFSTLSSLGLIGCMSSS